MDGWFDGRHLKGLALRYFLVLHLVETDRVQSAGQLVEAVLGAGFELHGRPGKTVSDALRWEVRRGRVVRRGRGNYEAGRVTRQTTSRMRLRVSALRSRVGVVAGMCDIEQYADKSSIRLSDDLPFG